MIEKREQLNVSHNGCLIIEDNDLIAEMYTQLLNYHNIDSTRVDNLEDAYKEIDKNEFKFIILDGEFPKKNGQSPDTNYKKIINKCHNKAKGNHQRPIISLISGNIDISQCEDILTKGKLDFFYPKPCRNISTLLTIIQNFTGIGISYGSRRSDILHTKNNKSNNNFLFFLNDNVKTESRNNNIHTAKYYNTDIISKIFISPLLTDYLTKNNKYKLA